MATDTHHNNPKLDCLRPSHRELILAMLPCLRLLTFVRAPFSSDAAMASRLLLHAVICEIACFVRKPSMLSLAYSTSRSDFSCPQQASGKASSVASLQHLANCRKCTRDLSSPVNVCTLRGSFLRRTLGSHSSSSCLWSCCVASAVSSLDSGDCCFPRCSHQIDKISR